MLKRSILLVLVIVLLSSFFACAESSSPTTPAPSMPASAPTLPSTTTISDELKEGDTETYMINDKIYSVEVLSVSSEGLAKFRINGEITSELAVGETDVLADGTQVGIRDILATGKDIQKSIVQFYIDAYKVIEEMTPEEEEVVTPQEEEVTAPEEEEVVEEEEAPAPETVIFHDENLEAAISDALGKPVGEEITVAELATLATLVAESSNITDLSGLEYCTNLTGLWLRDIQINDITPLSSLTSLTRLGLLQAQISDISPLSSLINLTFLNLYANEISDISPLSNLTSLTDLVLHGNQISDISPLANLTSLIELRLGENQISDISPLSSLTNLTLLNLYGNEISDISALVENSGLDSEDELWLEDNNLDLSEDSEDMNNIQQLKARGVNVQYE